MNSRWRGRLMSFAAFLLLSQTLAAQDLRDGFFTQVSGGRVLAMAIEADGRVLIGGEFTTVNGVSCASLCRINVDGSVANAFPFFIVDQVVTALAVQPDGRIVYASFSFGISGVGRLFSDGSHDFSLDRVMGSVVNALAIERDGTILVGGEAGMQPGLDTSSLVRLSVEGSIDNAFTPRFGTLGASVRAIALRHDGAIYIGGNFGAINGDSRLNLALLTADGRLDDTLDRAVTGVVSALALEPDGSLLIGGAFSRVINSDRTNLARILPDTTLDESFAPAISGEVLAVEALADGGIAIGGRFSTVAGASRRGLARLRRDGTLLPAAEADALASGAVVSVVREQSDRRLLFGGRFSVMGLQQNENLARVGDDGRLDQSLSVPPSTATTAVLQQPDGRLLVARRDGCGSGGRSCLRRLFSDGSIDASFVTPGFNAGITGLSLLPDGDVLVQGDFTQIDGATRANLVRLNADGSEDANFALPAGLRVVDFERLGDGRIVVSGTLTPPGQARRAVLEWLLPDGSPDPGADATILGLHDAGSMALDAEQRALLEFRPRDASDPHLLVRFLTGGPPDENFLVETDGPIRAIHALPDGGVLIGGSFLQVNSTPVPYLARLLPDGSLDTRFNAQLGLPAAPAPSAQRGVNTLAVRHDGRIVAGLSADSLLAVQSSLRLLEPNGVMIGTFAPSLLGVVDTVSLQHDGRVLFGGRFTTAFGSTRIGLARLALPGAAGASLRVIEDSAILQRGPAAPELVAAPRLSVSLDGNVFFFDQPFKRDGDGWRLDDLSLPVGVSYSLRVRETPGHGVAAAAQGLTQHVFLQAPDARLFRNGFETDAP